MGEPAVQLKAIGEANAEVRGVAHQALEWVRQSEERLSRSEARAAEAEKKLSQASARAEKAQSVMKERAKVTLAKIAEEGRTHLERERRRRLEAEAAAKRAEAARDRAECSFEQTQLRAGKDREALLEELTVVKAKASNEISSAIERTRKEASERTREVLERAQAEADKRVAAAEQRAADAEARTQEAHDVAVRIEAEIEERVMRGTEDVRREADRRVNDLVAKVEGEAAEKARARAEEQLKAESERIRVQAEQREERVREAAEEEITASAKKARREVLAAADETAPAWSRRGSSPSEAVYRTF